MTSHVAPVARTLVAIETLVSSVTSTFLRLVIPAAGRSHASIGPVRVRRDHSRAWSG